MLINAKPLQLNKLAKWRQFCDSIYFQATPFTFTYLLLLLQLSLRLRLRLLLLYLAVLFEVCGRAVLHFVSVHFCFVFYAFFNC